MLTGCECIAMVLIFNPYSLYSLSLWEQPLPVELKYSTVLLAASV